MSQIDPGSCFIHFIPFTDFWMGYMLRWTAGPVVIGYLCLVALLLPSLAVSSAYLSKTRQ